MTEQNQDSFDTSFHQRSLEQSISHNITLITLQQQSIRNFCKAKLQSRYTKTNKKHRFQQNISRNLSYLLTKDDLNCPICLQTVIFPILTNCGHMICRNCIQQHLYHSNNCCVCRQYTSVSIDRFSTKFHSFITDYVRNFCSRDEFEEYMKRIVDQQQREERRKIAEEYTVGRYVDFYDDYARIWKQGIIVETKLIPTEPDQQENICIQSLDEGRLFFFDSNSRKVAKFLYFTKNIIFIEEEQDQDSQFTSQMQSYYENLYDSIDTLEDSSFASDQQNIDPNTPMTNIAQSIRRSDDHINNYPNTLNMTRTNYEN